MAYTYARGVVAWAEEKRGSGIEALSARARFSHARPSFTRQLSRASFAYSCKRRDDGFVAAAAPRNGATTIAFTRLRRGPPLFSCDRKKGKGKVPLAASELSDFAYLSEQGRKAGVIYIAAYPARILEELTFVLG